MRLVHIPPGRFLMGSPVGEKGQHNDEDEHVVILSRPFDPGTREVTVGQFGAFVAATGYRTEAERDATAAAVMTQKGTTLSAINPSIGAAPAGEQTEEQSIPSST